MTIVGTGIPEGGITSKIVEDDDPFELGVEVVGGIDGPDVGGCTKTSTVPAEGEDINVAFVSSSDNSALILGKGARSAPAWDTSWRNALFKRLEDFGGGRGYVNWIGGNSDNEEDEGDNREYGETHLGGFCVC